MNRIAKYTNNPFVLVNNPFTSLLEDVFTNFLGLPEQSTEKASYRYEETIRRDDAGYTIQAVLPGVSKDQLEIELQEDTLRLSKVGKQLRSYALPKDVDAENISAELIDGILTLRVPLKKPPSIKIQVK